MKCKAAVHVHSDWSYDGSWTLSELARAFRDRGYDVVLMTEHDKGFDEARWRDYCAACEESSTSDLLLVPGIEYSDADNVTHILCWGEDIGFLGEGLDTAATLQAGSDAGAVMVMAHPWRRRAHERYRESWRPHLVGVEAWNRKADGIAPRREALDMIADTSLVPFASLDFHRSRQFFPLSMQCDLGDRSPSVGSVLESLRERRVEAIAFGRPLSLFTGGVVGGAARAAESARGKLAAAVRKMA
ncbi:MAG: hypothetical protein AAGA20_07675 [Planctomycetota bacterium]